jgi:mono/diheme cytochrome c family protein
MRRAASLLALLAPVSLACGDASAPEPNAGDDSTGSPADTGTVPTTGVDDDDGDGATDTGAAVDPNAPTFYGDVLPVFIEHCSSCHTEGGIGPFELEDYELAKSLAEVIAIETDARRMPPFNANNDGSCNSFKDARWLSQAQIDLIAAWVDGGAQEGDPNAPQPEHPTLPELKGEDLADHAMPEGYQPVADAAGSNGYDDYQCFLVDLGVEGEPRYLTGYEVVPGNPAVTHHLVGFLVDPARASAAIGTNGEIMQLLDDATPDQPGWDCYGAAGNGVLPEGTPVTWAPGGGAFNFPEGTGIRIDPGYVLVAQMHYNLVNGDGEDTTVLRLSWADEVEREAVNALQDKFLAAGFSGAAEIPPGMESYVYQWDDRLSNYSSRIAGWNQVEILGLLPHMHELGTRMQADFIRAGTGEETCGIYVDRWDFAWQQAFMYEEPFILDPGDSIRVTCDWDSSDRTSPTTPGLGTQNEMCLMGIYAAEVK